MEKKNAEQVGDVLRRFLRQQGLEAPLNEFRLVESWREVVGDAVARYTTNLYIRNQTLVVHLSSSVLRQELFSFRHALVRRLNEQVGAQVITDIVLR